ncbi:YceI family protein [Geofilum sp. OHC36d9]|uniref:YceI family protein n=1 Tax=Geofilum sp. OHC36d9 TaxID=3458413 RepID=UPI0040338A5D
MKKIVFISGLLLIGVLGAGAQTLKLVKTDSHIEWTGKKIGGSHHGNINFTSGTLVYKENNYTDGVFIVDMKSITNTDLTDKDTNAKLIGHLKSDDFFGVEKYPTAKLIITKGVSTKKGNYEFTGSLTIKDKTNPVTFNVVRSVKEGTQIFKGKLVVDRSKFDVRYGSNSFFDNLGDNVIYDEFELDFTVVFK